MTSPFDYVQPGDIISASDFNSLLDALRDLQDRVQVLEASTGGPTGSMRITNLDPQFEQQVGRFLTINGQGFATPIIDPVTGLPRNTVIIGGVPIAASGFQTVGSNDLRLIVLVPTSLDSPPGTLGTNGREFTITVSNPAGSDERRYRLVSAINPGIPQPTLTDVVGPGDVGNVRVGQATRIRGSNFSTAPADNHVRVFVPGRGIGFGGAGEPAVVVTNASAGVVQFNMPDAFEVRPGNPAPFPPLPLSVTVTLTVGATNPVVGTISVAP